MDIVAIQQIKATLADWRGKKVVSFDPARDLPGCFAWYDASKLTGSNGSVVPLVGDQSGAGNGVSNQTTANQPTLNTAAQGGLNTLTFAAGQYLFGATGATTWQAPNRTQPLTYVALVKLRAAGSGTASRCPLGSAGSGGSTGTGIVVFPNTSADSWPYAYAGAVGTGGGQAVNDGAWHVLAVKMTATAGTVMVDGRVVAASITQSHGTNAAFGRMVLGALNTAGLDAFDGDFAEGGCFNADLTLKQLEHVTRYLTVKWGVSATVPGQGTVGFVDVTDGGGQVVRVYRPVTLAASGTQPLAVLNHQQGGTALVFPGNSGYTVVHELVNAGYVVAIPTNHGTDGWTGAASVADGAAAESAALTVVGLAAFGRVVLFGMSMGGALAPIQAKSGGFAAPVKGVYLIDAACNLRYMHGAGGYTNSINSGLGITSGTLSAAMASTGVTSVPTTASFPTVGTVLLLGAGTANEELVTTTGASTGTSVAVTATTKTHASGDRVDDYGTKALNRDPAAWATSDVPTGKRWRFIASTGDSTVSKANNSDVVKAIVDASSPVESTAASHTGGHLEVGAFWPKDAVDFANRCT